MRILNALACKLGRHEWELWSAGPHWMTTTLVYVCSRCNARRTA